MMLRSCCLVFQFSVFQFSVLSSQFLVFSFQFRIFLIEQVKLMLHYSNYLFFLIILILFACGGGGDRQEKEQVDSSEGDTLAEKGRAGDLKDVDTTGWQTYRNDDYHIALKYPAGWKVAEQDEPFQIINVYSTEHANDFKLPLKIHNKPIISHVSFFPDGYGTEFPSGKIASLEEWNGYIPTDFEVDKRRSTVFLTENNEAWGFLIRTSTPPAGWSKNGFIFIQIKSTEVSFTCIDKASGENKPMNDCDPLTGDIVKRAGKVSPDDKRKILKIIETIHFFDERNERRPLEDLIKVENPQPNDTISSPLKVSGKARGYWYFEGDFPVELVGVDGQVVGHGIARATDEWMTEDFVPFEVTIDYEHSGDGEGYLLFKRSNASGMPEHDRTYRIPVKFSEED
jgi:hypothetical protein